MKDAFDYLKDSYEYRKRKNQEKKNAKPAQVVEAKEAARSSSIKPVIQEPVAPQGPRREPSEERLQREKAERLLARYNEEIKKGREKQGPPPPIPPRPHAKTLNPGSDSETSPRDFSNPPNKALPVLKKKPKKNLEQFLAGEHKAPPKPPGMK